MWSGVNRGWLTEWGRRGRISGIKGDQGRSKEIVRGERRRLCGDAINQEGAMSEGEGEGRR